MDTFERHVSVLVGALVKAAVTELGTLAEQRSADTAAAQQRPAAAPAPLTGVGTPVKDEEEEEERGETPPPGGSRPFDKAVTSQFESLMEVWAKGAVEEIVKMLQVSMCASEDGPAAEQTAGHSDDTKHTSSKPKEGPVAEPNDQSAFRSSCQRRDKIKGGLKPPRGQENDHMYSKAIADTPERSSGPLSEPEALLTELTSELSSDVSGTEIIHKDADMSVSMPQIRKKKSPGPFKCPSCDKSFTLKCFLDRHYLSHSKPHLCTECGKRFAGSLGLIAHSRRHTGEKLYKCSDCGTEFAYKSTFTRHMRQHSLKKPNTHMCTLCENHFSDLSALQRHRCCAVNKTFVCSLCPETFECRQSLADHENLHPGNRDFVCEMCGESFFSFSSLATHRVTHSQKENCCDVLGLGCSDMSVLKSHLSKHSGEKLFTCEVCGKGCSHQSALKHHMLTHTGERPYVCETCGKRCGHASALQNHMRIHTGRKAGQQPVCDTCGKTFRSMVKLRYHMSIHTGEKPYACDQCDKKFSNPSNLKIHTAVHSGEKMYGCNVCGRRFTQAASLKQHRLLHTGERPYRCASCGEQFRLSSDLRKHRRSHWPDGGGLQ